MLNRLQDKVAVITGSTRGLGRAMAEVFAREGAKVVISGRTQPAVDEVVESLRMQSYTATGLACDVRNRWQVEALAEHAAHTFGRIDIWINNAGLSGDMARTLDIPRENWEQVTMTNIMGVYNGSVSALKYMLPRHKGKLINLIGRGTSGATPYGSAYGPSKMWVLRFTQTLASEYKESGVGIYAFNPGLVVTDLLTQQRVIGPEPQQQLGRFQTVVRMLGENPEVPARKAAWLASAATDGQTGKVVKAYSKTQMLRGVLREMVRRIRRQPVPPSPFKFTYVDLPDPLD